MKQAKMDEAINYMLSRHKVGPRSGWFPLKYNKREPRSRLLGQTTIANQRTGRPMLVLWWRELDRLDCMYWDTLRTKSQLILAARKRGRKIYHNNLRLLEEKEK